MVCRRCTHRTAPCEDLAAQTRTLVALHRRQHKLATLGKQPRVDGRLGCEGMLSRLVERRHGDVELGAAAGFACGVAGQDACGGLGVRGVLPEQMIRDQGW
jgi:hypothetical protein